jgi:CheY-like chemotaxis protein
VTDLAPSKKRLLVIDDDDGIREVFRFTMEKEGFIVEEAADGNTGLQQVPEFEPDLIVVDLMMPNGNGFEVIRNLQVLGFAKIPVVVMTGYTDASSEESVKQERNVIALLKKPVNYTELLGIIHQRFAKKP